MPTPKHSVVVKTIIWYQNSIKFLSYKHAGLFKTWNPVNLPNIQQFKDWCGVTKRVQH